MRRGRFEKERRQADAAERQEVRNTRTPSEQLARLDSLLGKNKGATKERARLLKQLKENELGE